MEKASTQLGSSERVVPDVPTLRQLGEAIGRSIESAGARRWVSSLPSEERGQFYLGYIFERPRYGSYMESEARLASIDAIDVGLFGQAIDRGRTEYASGLHPTRPPLSLDAIRRAVPAHRRLPMPMLSVVYADYVLSFFPHRGWGQSRVGETWYVHAVPVSDGRECRIRAEINLVWPFVGPFIESWEGAEPDRALAAIMDLLRDAFGDCIGLEISAWKVLQRVLDRRRGAKPSAA